MKYVGSKNRHAKELLPIILNGRKPDQWYVEPFVGGANMIDKVGGRRIGNDSHPHLICLLEAVAGGYNPPENVSEKEYQDASKNRVINPTVAFIGFGCSFSGKWFGGYARGADKNGFPRNYASESARNLMKQREGLKGVTFSCGSYKDLMLPKETIIYCDPPYQGTVKYSVGSLDYNEFWQWCRDKTLDGHKVFISEYNAPDDFECIWAKKVNNTLDKNTGAKQGVEKLFRFANI